MSRDVKGAVGYGW